MYLALSGLSYLVFFVAGRSRFHPDYEADPVANGRAIRLGVVGTLGNAVLVLPIHLLIANGHSKIYWDIGDHGWAWLGASVVLYLVFTETCIYWAHRWLHTDVGYRRLHRHHHEWRATTPWVSMAFHPLDLFLQAVPHHVFGFHVPLHGMVYLTYLAVVSVWAVNIHDRVSFVRWKAINNTGHHTLHHWYSAHNYGQFFTFWDRLMGTYRNPDLAVVGDDLPAGLLADVSRPGAELAAPAGRR